VSKHGATEWPKHGECQKKGYEQPTAAEQPADQWKKEVKRFLD
jgi:hypothetical protein